MAPTGTTLIGAHHTEHASSIEFDLIVVGGGITGAWATLLASRAGLRVCLVEARDCRMRLIVTDGVFSMDGIVANLPAICDLAEKYDASVMVSCTAASATCNRWTSHACVSPSKSVRCTRVNSPNLSSRSPA